MANQTPAVVMDKYVSSPQLAHCELLHMVGHGTEISVFAAVQGSRSSVSKSYEMCIDQQTDCNL